MSLLDARSIAARLIIALAPAAFFGTILETGPARADTTVLWAVNTTEDPAPPNAWAGEALAAGPTCLTDCACDGTDSAVKDFSNSGYIDTTGGFDTLTLPENHVISSIRFNSLVRYGTGGDPGSQIRLYATSPVPGSGVYCPYDDNQCPPAVKTSHNSNTWGSDNGTCRYRDWTNANQPGVPGPDLELFGLQPFFPPSPTEQNVNELHIGIRPANNNTDDFYVKGMRLVITHANVCGNGVVDPLAKRLGGGLGEDCDLAGANGQPGSCCTANCRFVAGGTSCRPAAGICDVPEVCTGASGACPADGFASGGACRGSAGACDVPETCQGNSPHCPVDGFAIGGICRGSAGLCDVAEVCQGNSADCPADGFASGSTCRSSAGTCDVAEVCPGGTPHCPSDGFASGNVCRPPAGQCDPAELCDGSGPACPPDVGPPVPACGDGAVQCGECCDLGSSNGAGFGCSAECECTGRCLADESPGICGTNPQSCVTLGDCPPSACPGCCGNGVLEGVEECDDGNDDSGDCCSPACTIESNAACVPPCPGFAGPQLLNPVAMRVRFLDKDFNGTYERWSTSPRGKPGDMILAPGQSIDPRAEDTTLVFFENDGSGGLRNLGQFTIEPTDWTKCAVSPSGPDDENCSLRDRTETLSEPDGVKGALLKESGARVKYKFKGVELATIAKPTFVDGHGRIRACVVFGNEDAGSGVLACEESGGGRRVVCDTVN